MAGFVIDQEIYDKAEYRSQNDGFTWDYDVDNKMLYVRASPSIANLGFAFLWKPCPNFSHVSFEFGGKGGYTLLGAHFTVSAGTYVAGNKTRLEFCSRDRSPVPVEDLVDLVAGNPDASKNRVGAARDGSYQEPVYEKFAQLLEANPKPPYQWVSPEARDAYMVQVKRMTEEVVKICHDFGMTDTTEFPVKNI